MIPGARIQAAIEVLDAITDGAPAEQALTRWARANRYAGSKDRRAVRDHVFDALRVKALAAHLGGRATGRGLMLGTLRAQGTDPKAFFTGDRFCPAPLSEADGPRETDPDVAARWNLPPWLVKAFQTALGPQAEAEALALQTRAPLFVRVNRLKTSPDTAVKALADEGIAARPHHAAPDALELIEGGHRLRQTRAFLDGLVEPQDVHSQAAVAALPDVAGSILDTCAGGGGKTLALAARYGKPVDAWDIDPRRMRDIPARAARAGARITCLAEPPSKSYALVFADAPCSGSGAWRRSPDAKWRLTLDDLTRLETAQDAVLDAAAARVAEGGVLAYATCSMLACENGDRVRAFVARHPRWTCLSDRSWRVSEGGDGFYLALLTRS
ncbi:RsmB/NOP family class I SAM-dependent RNA methyltransferase [Pseudaestuariivita sp.]|uniref:RsmB/NOP family class I SAM-dependent RNA methyltransferase n=1 Tax=Pseudaestuariivita sp. TaxID=2211669 RepID=UPI00405998D1